MSQNPNRIKISQVQSLMTQAYKLGYAPILTINGEYYSIDYQDKKITEAEKVRQEGRD